MTSATATPNQDALVSEIHIAAPPEHVFQALIDEKKVMQWWTSDECHIKSFSLEPRKGGRWIYDSKSGNHNVKGKFWSTLRRACSATPGSQIGTIARWRGRLCAGNSPTAREGHWCV